MRNGNIINLADYRAHKPVQWEINPAPFVGILAVVLWVGIWLAAWVMLP